jgi:signal transduction histidine kinase
MLLSLASCALFLQVSLRRTTDSVVADFLSQNSPEILQEDTAGLIHRLNLLASGSEWVCMSAALEGVPLYLRKKGDCSSGIFRRAMELNTGPGNRLTLGFTLESSESLKVFSGLFLSFQLLSSLGFLILGRRIELARVRGDLQVAELARQVAHDIKSPLSALQALEGELGGLSPEHRQLAEGAIERIRSIARGLLEKTPISLSDPVAHPEGHPEVTQLAGLLSAIAAEKKLQLQATPGISLVVDWSAINTLLVTVDAAQFQRVLSNLLNNAIEALPGQGRIEIAADLRGQEVDIHIKDNGRGIPAELLPKLTQKGATFGKAGGHGLGLHHARRMLESWGGGLAITSQYGRGTTVTLTLPVASRSPSREI